MNNFISALETKLILSQSNDFGIDNYDEFRFGKFGIPNHSQSLNFKTLKRKIKRLIGYKKTQLLNSQFDGLKSVLTDLQNKYGENLQKFYEQLNSVDQELLIAIVAYRLIGYKKIKLPTNNKAYWESLILANSLIDKNDTFDPNFMHFILEKCDLRKIGYDIQLYFSALGVTVDYILEQYAYKFEGKSVVAVEKGDVVLDIGACWGDTALYFACKTGNEGKVYPFEFIPENIKLFNMNLALNSDLQKQIELIKHPVSNKSGDIIHYLDKGPCSRIEFVPFEGETGSTTTLSIDDFVIQNRIEKVDFIKMDIEGAENMALEGAIQTIRQFKPKLAIAIYHSMEDLVNIPNWINDLNLGYKLYLGHYTIHAEETVIFAKVENE